MDNLWVAFILSIVEGLTEYLPVSSSGHLVLVGDLLNFSGEKAATFQVVIQLGAIMAVVVLYWGRFWGLLRPQQGVPFAGLRGIWMLFLTCVPACVLGLLLLSQIKSLFTPSMVLIRFVIGALLMIFVERRQFHPRYETLDDMTPGLAFGIGCFQCLALFPGFSRSAATRLAGALLTKPGLFSLPSARAISPSRFWRSLFRRAFSFSKSTSSPRGMKNSPAPHTALTVFSVICASFCSNSSWLTLARRAKYTSVPWKASCQPSAGRTIRRAL